MKRIGNLGLALVAALALTSILGVASASAGFAAFEGEENVAGTAQAENIYTPGHEPSLEWMIIDTGLFDTQCHVTLANGSVEPFEEGNDETSDPIADAYSFCEGEEEFYNANGCGLNFHVPGYVIGGEAEGTVEIADAGESECKGIEVISTDKWGFECVSTIPPQSGLEATVWNVDGGESTDWVKVEMHATGMEVINESGGSPIFCPEEEHSSGSWEGTWKVEVKNEGGELLDLKAVGLERTLYQISTGEKKFESEQYPVEIKGGPNDVTMSLGSHNVVCPTTFYGAVITEATSYLPNVSAEDTACETKAGLYAVAIMNSCDYKIFANSLGVTCAEEGDAIEVLITNEKKEIQCVNTIGEQFEFGGPLSYANNEAGILLSFNEAPITFTSEGGFFKCGVSEGEHPGYYTGSMQLFGIY